MPELLGNREVLRNYWRVKDLLDKGLPDDHVRIADFVGPGVLRGTSSAGAGGAFEELKLFDVPKIAVGSSTGSASRPFASAGQLRKDRDTYWNEAASSDFISFRAPLTGRPVQNTRYLCEVFRRKLDQDAVRKRRTELYFAVTHAKSGEGHLLNAKEIPDMIEGIRASISIPGLCEGPVYIEGEPYYDGFGAMALPMREIIERFRPTDLMIFLHAPLGERGSLYYKALMKFLTRDLSPAAREAFLTSEERVAKNIEYLEEQKHVRWLIFCADRMRAFNRNRDRLEAAALSAHEFMREQLLLARDEVQAQQLQAAE